MESVIPSDLTFEFALEILYSVNLDSLLALHLKDSENPSKISFFENILDGFNQQALVYEIHANILVKIDREIDRIVSSFSSLDDIEESEFLELGKLISFFAERKNFTLGDKAKVHNSLFNVSNELIVESFNSLFLEVEAANLEAEVHKAIEKKLEILSEISKRVSPNLTRTKFDLLDRRVFSLGFSIQGRTNFFNSKQREVLQTVLSSRYKTIVKNYLNEDLYKTNEKSYLENEKLKKIIQLNKLYLENDITNQVALEEREHNLFLKAQIAIFLIIDQLEINSNENPSNNEKVKLALKLLIEEELSLEEFKDSLGGTAKREFPELESLNLANPYEMISYLERKYTTTLNQELGFSTKENGRLILHLEKRLDSDRLVDRELEGISKLLSGNLSKYYDMFSKL